MKQQKPQRLPYKRSNHVYESSYKLIDDGDGPSWAYGYERCDGDYSIDRPCGYPNQVLEFILDGEGFATVDGRKHPLYRGFSWKYGPHIPVSFESTSTAPLTKAFLIGLKPSSSLPLMNGIVLGVHNCRRRCDSIESLFRKLSGIDRNDAAAIPESTSIISSILKQISACKDHSTKAVQTATLVEDAVDLLDSHLTTIKSGQQIAAELGVSYSKFRQAFKTHTGKSPHAFIVDYRINYAYRLLRSKAGNVRQIAERAGFEDSFHFSRVFKQKLFYSPSTLLN